MGKFFAPWYKRRKPVATQPSIWQKICEDLAYLAYWGLLSGIMTAMVVVMIVFGKR